MKWIVYVTVCTVNNKIYVGCHKTEDPTIFDGYLGCGVYTSRPSSYKKSYTPFQYAVNKYGIDKFKRCILKVVDNEEEAKQLEAEIVTLDFIKRKDTYNIKLGGDGGCPEKWMVKVYMYDLEGNYIREFESAFDCNKFFDKNAKNGSAVLKAIRTGQTLHGYQFSREFLPCMKKYIIKRGSHNNKRRVGKFDDNDILVEEFPSTLACVKAGYLNVSKALKYPKRKCKGFYFKYLD